LGLRLFAYCGSSFRTNYVDHFGEAYVGLLKQRGYGCHTYTPRFNPDSVMPPADELERLVEWLRALPKPIGLLTFDSLQARQVTEACEAGGVHVPHEVAVLGGEYDHLSCTISKPKVSSIDHSPHQVGYAAAELLARLMKGEPPPPEPILIPPARVITCQSTDTLAIEEDLLAAAVRFIKRHSHERIQVTDILREVPLSRRALEKGFQARLGRSPAEEIRRVRVEHAVQLLCDTNWRMPKIAAASGFDRAELLTRAFRRELGTTPTEFRRQHQGGQ
jgi:LacI family transcriptional regulator